MNFITFILLLSVNTIVAADDCSCPVVECSPCQVRMSLGEETKSCGREKSITCNKYVCENVDNFFACQAGQDPSFVPPESLAEFLTTPHDLEEARLQAAKNERRLQEIYGVSSEANIAEDESGAVQDDVTDIQVTPLTLEPKRQLASVSKKTTPVPKKITVSGYYYSYKGVKKARLSLHSWRKYAGVTTLHVFSQKNSYKLKILAPSELSFEEQEDTLVVHMRRGHFQAQVKKSTGSPLTFDFGQWRIGKSAGIIDVQTKASSHIIKNKKEPMWLRPDQLIARSEKIDAGVEVILSDDVTPIAYHIPQQKPGAVVPKKRVQIVAGDLWRRVASQSPGTEGCQLPRGKYEQCAWKCFGKDEGSESCDSAKGDAQCVRFTCAIDGQWKLPTQSAPTACYGAQVRVGKCQ